MLPEIWGPYGWKFLHLVTLGYPENPTEQDMINYKKYINALQKVLPCEKCRNNMHKHMNKIPLTADILSSRKEFIKWGIDFHNIVNYYTGKKMLSYPEATKELELLLNPKKIEKSDYLLYALIIIIIILIAYIYHTNKKN